MAAGRHAIAPDVRGHDRATGCHAFEQHHAERLAVQRRRAEHVGPGEPGCDLVVTDHPEPVEAIRLGVTPSLHLGGGSVTRHPQDGGSLEHGEGVEQHAETLALLMATDEENRRPAWLVVVVYGHRRFEAPHVDAVEEHFEPATA